MVAADLLLPEGKEILLLVSGRECLKGSAGEGVAIFMLTDVPASFDKTALFGSTPPVLFLLDTVPVDLLLPEIESPPLFGSILFLLETVGLANRALSRVIGFAVLVTDLGVPEGVATIVGTCVSSTSIIFSQNQPMRCKKAAQMKSKG